MRLNTVKWKLALKIRCLFSIFVTSPIAPSFANADVFNFTGVTSPVVDLFGCTNSNRKQRIDSKMLSGAWEALVLLHVAWSLGTRLTPLY